MERIALNQTQGPSGEAVPRETAFADPQAALAALDAFVEALAASPWLRPGELRGVMEEAGALREVVKLSGCPEAKAIP